MKSEPKKIDLQIFVKHPDPQPHHPCVQDIDPKHLLQLIFVPDIEIAPISPHEYLLILFLVDHSGSMNGSSMETVK